MLAKGRVNECFRRDFTERKWEVILVKGQKEFTGPEKYMYDNYGTDSIKYVATWIRITADDGDLRFPQNGTFDQTRLENLKH